MERRTTQVVRASRTLIWAAQLAPPTVAVLACALALGRLCKRTCPDGLDTILAVVRDSYAAS